MKRFSIIIALALALGGGALAVAQEPDHTINSPNDLTANPLVDQRALGDQQAPRPHEAPEQESPPAAEIDAALKATLSRVGRDAVAAEAEPVAKAESDDCLLADEHKNIQVLLTKECVAEVKSTLAEVNSEQPDAKDPSGAEERPASQRP